MPVKKIESNRRQAQGSFKYGGYEFFKKFYSDLAGPDVAHRYKTSLYLTASASAEFLADIALCPFEAVKVRMQTTMPPFATGTFSGISTITGKEGTAGYICPLHGDITLHANCSYKPFQGSLSPLGSTDSIYYDEICLL